MAKFPDLTGDGQVTQADVLKGRGVYKKGGSVMKNDHGHKPMAKMSHGGHYCWGGKVMKKAEGGDVKVEKAKTMPSGAQQWTRGSGHAEKATNINESIYDSGMKGVFGKTKSERDINKKASSKLQDAFDDEMSDWDKDIKEGKYAMKRGGMAKGGNWIQSAIKKPGALKKSLGVPMGEKIPAGKLKTASKTPGKMGQRARMAMTLKGMK